LASLDFGPREIAVMLGFNKRYFPAMARDEDTEIGLAYLKGRLMCKETIRVSLNNSVLDDNVTASQIKIKQSEALDFQDIKAQIFGL
jgi:hypothetical protein